MLMSLMIRYCHLSNEAFIIFESAKMLSIFHFLYLECLKCIVGLIFLSVTIFFNARLKGKNLEQIISSQAYSNLDAKIYFRSKLK